MVRILIVVAFLTPFFYVRVRYADWFAGLAEAIEGEINCLFER